jgi:ribosomal protein S18 acetylase RimI-like enzyme
MIRTLEELSLNALPALQTLVLDGWVLRFAAGYTRRANSVSPLYPAGAEAVGRVRACERLYAAQGLRTVFKLTPVAQPAGLDQCLAGLGYRLEARTSVQTLSLAESPHPADGPTPAINSALSESWLAALGALAQVEGRHRPTLARMLGSLIPTPGFALIEEAGRAVACGLGVVQGGYVGLFDVVTAPDARRRGLGRRLVAGLLDWGRQNGAHTAYLQVMHANQPALGLYAALGFREVYSYWYRVQPTGP